MLKKFVTRLKKDSANAVLVTVIIFMPLLMIAVGFAADMSKSSYVKNSYVTMSQKSADTAVSAINGRGSLDNAAVQKFVSEFKAQSGGSDFHTNETLSYSSSDTCSTKVINNVERDLPYIEVKLETARGEGSISTEAYGIERGAAVPTKNLNPNVKFKVISADVYTASPNFMLGMFGTPCQYLKSSVSAISFGSNEDLK